MTFTPDPGEYDYARRAVTKVIGVGNHGIRQVEWMKQRGINGPVLVAVSDDPRELAISTCDSRFDLSAFLSRSSGTGIPSRQMEAALRAELVDTDLAIMACGLGGNRCPRIAALVASTARSLGALTVGVASLPFRFEGNLRRQNAMRAIPTLQSSVDALIVYPYEPVADATADWDTRFLIAWELTRMCVRGITDPVHWRTPGGVCVDLADVRTILQDGGLGRLGYGAAHGSERAALAARSALESPYWDGFQIGSATGLFVNIVSDPGFTLGQVSEAMEIITAACDEEANIIYQTVPNEGMENECRITILGFSRMQNVQEVR